MRIPSYNCVLRLAAWASVLSLSTIALWCSSAENLQGADKQSAVPRASGNLDSARAYANGDRTSISAYATAVLDLMEKHSIRTKDVDWADLRARVLDAVAGLKDIADAYPILVAAVSGLGDHHSSFVTPEVADAYLKGDADPILPWFEPTGGIVYGRLAYVSMPSYIGLGQSRMTRFADAVQSIIASTDSPSVCGWIVDLRENTGGSVAPMLAGIGPLLDGDDLGGGVRADGSTYARHYENGRSGFASVSRQPYTLIGGPKPIAVLIGPKTASAGEAIALSFIGRPDTKTFGKPTAGLTTGNRAFFLEDGAVLNLAVSFMTDRTGRQYENGLYPDAYVDSLDASRAIHAASEWLLSRNHCT